MSCTQTLAGNVLDCREGVGGIKALYIASHSDVTATVDSTADTITGITMAASSHFYKYELQEDSNSLTTSRQGDDTTGSFYCQTDIVAVLGHMSATRRKEAKALSKSHLFVVAEYNSGQHVAVGIDRPAVVTAMDIESGAALGDAEKIQLTVTGRDNEPPYVLTSTAVEAVTAALPS